jgi:hypothetical protein
MMTCTRKSFEWPSNGVTTPFEGVSTAATSWSTFGLALRAAIRLKRRACAILGRLGAFLAPRHVENAGLAVTRLAIPPSLALTRCVPPLTV